MSSGRSGRLRMLAVVVGLAVAAGLVGYTVVAGLSLPGVNGDSSPDNATLDGEALEDRIVEAVNERRAERGLTAVEPDPEIAAVARNHSADMAEREYYAHETPEGVGPADRLDAGGVDCDAVGENIATTWFQQPVETDEGTESYDSAKELAAALVDQWTQSLSHRNNMLDPRWEVTGVGIEQADDGEVIATQVFCTNSR